MLFGTCLFTYDSSALMSTKTVLSTRQFFFTSLTMRQHEECKHPVSDVQTSAATKVECTLGHRHSHRTALDNRHQEGGSPLAIVCISWYDTTRVCNSGHLPNKPVEEGPHASVRLTLTESDKLLKYGLYGTKSARHSRTHAESIATAALSYL